MPRILHWLTGLFGTLLFFAFIFLIIPNNDANEAIVRFDQASRCDEDLGNVPLNSKSIIATFNKPAVIKSDCWYPVTLPENNPFQDLKLDIETPQLQRIWYRIHYKVPENWYSNMPLMVYVPRIIANAWQIKVNGRFNADNRYEWHSTWNHPASAIFFADQTSPEATIDIDVGIIASQAEGFSMSRISVGDAAVIRSQKFFREYLQVTMPQASSALVLMLGLFFMMLGLSRRNEIEYLLLAVTSLLWSVTNLRYTVIQLENPNLDTWVYALVYDLPHSWVIWLIYLITARFAHYTNLLLEWFLWLFLVASSLLTLWGIFTHHDYSAIRGIGDLFISILFIGNITRHAFSVKNNALYVIAFSLVLSLLSGIYDAALLFNTINPEGFLCNVYFGLTLFAAFFYAIQGRYVTAITKHEHLIVDLAQQLTAREQLTQKLKARQLELQTQQNRLLQLEREQTLALERQRLMHDMHDGLGSSLLTTLSAIEKHTMSQVEVAEALKACIEDLRLIIDSLEPTANDLVTLLGTIRYRLGKRLASAGLELKWEINDLPPLTWLEPPDALNVLRLVQEALVNILKHANATWVKVATVDQGESVAILIEDNGCGYDAKTIRLGRGSQSQKKRSASLGGQLIVTSIPGQGTALLLILPIKK